MRRLDYMSKTGQPEMGAEVSTRSISKGRTKKSKAGQKSEVSLGQPKSEIGR